MSSIRVNCLACGHNVVLGGDEYSDYVGLVKCFGCGAILEIKTEEGQIKVVQFVQIARDIDTEMESDEALEAACAASAGINY